MKGNNLLLWAVAVMLAGAGTAGAEDAQKGPTPQIAVEPASFDFGRALTHKTLSKDFTIRNVGEATLEIRGVRKSCGCTATLLASDSIEPGGHTVLQVTLDTRSHPGKLRRSVYVESSDPTQAVLEIPLTVEVVAAEKEEK